MRIEGTRSLFQKHRPFGELGLCSFGVVEMALSFSTFPLCLLYGALSWSARRVDQVIQ